MRLLLHIGTEKTGSTAIQEALQNSRTHLLKQGYALPAFLHEANHRALACAFISDAESDDFLRAQGLLDGADRAAFRDQLLESLAADLRSLESRAHSYVLSSEHFHSRLRSVEEVEYFARRVLPLFSSVRILCYLRRQDRLALSFYSQKLRDGYVPPSILPLQNLERWAPRLPPFFDYEALLDRWETACPGATIQPRIYSSAALIGGDVVSDVFDWMACPAPLEVDPMRANVSLSSAAQSALLAFNRAQGGDIPGRSRTQALRGRLSAFLEQRESGRSRLPSRREAWQWLQAFEAANHRVAQHWFGREELFDDNLEDYPEEETRPDWERAATLLAEFIDLADSPGIVQYGQEP